MSDVNNCCYKCSATLDLDNTSKVHRSEECPKCFADVRCCKMCQFYDKSAYNDCREPTADRILNKEKANYCDFFFFISKNENDSNAGNFQNAADALFKS